MPSYMNGVCISVHITQVGPKLLKGPDWFKCAA